MTVNLGSTYNGQTITGTPFAGNAAVGGVWYTGTDFPAQYRNTFFAADYGAAWIRNFVFDGNDNLQAVNDFATNAGGVVALATHPQTGGLYYISWASVRPQGVLPADPARGPGGRDARCRAHRRWSCPSSAMAPTTPRACP